MSLVEPGTVAVDSEGPKVQVISTEYDDESSATFSIRDEDHTLLNPLRWMIQKNPSVTFCGYSIPHPSESKANLRIQTDGSVSAVSILHASLDSLLDLCDHVGSTFDAKLQEFESKVQVE